ncbi:DUF1249 domain-containing protein [Alteromonas sp. a30]|uniref:DUF1249 domain-containing protein n=1 Tax=Alteromonas sp. a30 TaxID=2730917 RepID=UPI0022829C86|nr:DUF1249 domain-containing protein [Alteromonas sp. a30]MCY7296280.1 DUF1249 domain-containing protein [Alteromonas sp. a30]
MTTRNSKRYYPDLRTLHSVCDVNYVRLLKLLPDCDTEQLQYEFGAKNALQYRITIEEVSRYTSTVVMSQINPEMPNYLKPSMRIRLYHDARMAEVIASQNIARFEASYEYPNKNMHQRNEKEMVNHFLSEWLSFCLNHYSPAQSTSAT